MKHPLRLKRLLIWSALLLIPLLLIACQIADAPDGWGAVTEDPAVEGRIVFPTGGEEVVAIDAASGIIAWQFPKDGNDIRMPGLDDDLETSAFYADPIWSSFSGEWLVGEYSDGILWAVRGDGRSARAIYSTGARIVATPALDGQLAYIPTNDDRVIAVDIERPQEAVWEWDGGTGLAILGSPVLLDTDAGKLLIFASLDGWVTALRVDGPEPGQAAWRKEIGAGLASAVTAGDGLAYFGAFDRTFYAIRPADGETVWTASGANWFWGSPLVAEGAVYVSDVRGNVYAWDARSGQPRWPAPYQSGEDRMRSRPVLVDVQGIPVLAVVARDGSIHQINADTGQAAFPFEIRVDGDVLSDPRIVGGRLLVGNEGGQLWSAVLGVNAAPQKIYEAD